MGCNCGNKNKQSTTSTQATTIAPKTPITPYTTVVGAMGPVKPPGMVGPGPTQPGSVMSIPPLARPPGEPARVHVAEHVEPAKPSPMPAQPPTSVTPLQPENLTQTAPNKTYNIFNAAIDTAKAALGKQDVFVNEELRQKRLSVCNTCQNKRLGRCTICGCVIDLKVRYTQSECPIKKW